MKQQELFPGMAEKERALDMVEVGAEGWVNEVGIPTLARVCSYRTWVQSAHLEHFITSRELPYPEEKRAYGAVFRAAMSQGWLRATQEYRPSDVPEVAKQNHRRPMKVWLVVHHKLPKRGE